MESTTLKAENLKPVILKAGVPLAVSLAGVIYAWIMAKKSLSKASPLSENITDTPETKDSHHGTMHEESYQSLSSVEDEEPATPMDSSVHSGRLVIHDNPCLEQDISGLRRRIEGLQMRELALSSQFDRYCDMKEQESLLMEIKNMLSLESARVEFLDREISTLEAENLRLENFVVQYLKVIEQLEYWRSENRVLHKKVQKLLRKSKAQSRLIKEQAMKIKAEEAEILRNHDALQTRISVINKLEDEIRELQGVLDQLQDEKNELLKKLDTAEKAYASKVHKGHQHVHIKSLKHWQEIIE